jgi:hypothetical protein
MHIGTPFHGDNQRSRCMSLSGTSNYVKDQGILRIGTVGVMNEDVNIPVISWSDSPCLVNPGTGTQAPVATSIGLSYWQNRASDPRGKCSKGTGFRFRCYERHIEPEIGAHFRGRQ